MNWDQIESKWADMTRRVRGDSSNNNMNVADAMPRQVASSGENAGTDLEQQTNTDADLTMSAR